MVFWRGPCRGSPSGFWLSDLEGNILEVNETYIRMSGHTRAELLRMRISDLEANEKPDEVLRHTQLICERQSDQFESRELRRNEEEYRLPVQQAPKTAVEAETERMPRRRILVVDDNVDAVEMMRVLLEKEGHEIASANDGDAAIEIAVRCPPEIALIDLGMPGMDGYELARRLRQEPSLARTKLIALTGYGQEDDIQKSRQAGFDHHLVKPVDLNAIRSLLR